MHQLFFRLHTYITHHLRTILSRRGYGIHSPFAFDIVTNIINPERPSYFYFFDHIEQLRYKLKDNSTSVRLVNSERTSIRKVARKSTSPRRDGQLLFRIALYMQSKTIIELGTSLGIGTAYLACANKKAQVTSLDHNVHIQKQAKQNLQILGINNVTLVNGTFDDTLPQALESMEALDMIFIDGHHQGKATLEYYEIVKTKMHHKSVCIFHDIHWSEDMYQAWKQVTQDPSNTLSIECYNLGIVFFRTDLNKQHFYA